MPYWFATLLSSKKWVGFDWPGSKEDMAGSVAGTEGR